VAGEQTSLPASVRVGDADVVLWPEGQRVEPLSAPLMAITRFDDRARYHGDLVATILEMERDPAYRLWIFKGGCGMKVRRPDQWRRPAADLIHGRAISFAHRVLSRSDVFTDDCWANVYRDGQYCMPHSHVRSNVSIVYLLDPGDPDPDDAMAGKLIFADPRIPYCCPQEAGRVTALMVPDLLEGTMIVFASDYLHSVNPYRGARPRMSMSWNVTLARLPGQADEEWRA
jgi:putative 2-oxoglutarate-Fe(II)-dependent oxygenase superfamily protein